MLRKVGSIITCMFQVEYDDTKIPLQTNQNS